MMSSKNKRDVIEVVGYVNTLYEMQNDYHKGDPRYKALDYAIGFIGNYIAPFITESEGVEGATGTY